MLPSNMRSAAGIAWPFAALVALSAAEGDSPQPLVIPASEYFEGNDGPWSTFNIRVGTPEQDTRVLVSTASPESIVVLSDQGCSSAAFPHSPPDCAVSRGKLFDQNDSSTWFDVGIYGINQNGVGLEANLGYQQRAEFALEHLAIGLAGPGFDNQTIAGIATPEPFYLGIFGLNSQPVNFTSIGNYSSPSFLTTLESNKKIPSLSWSYTAGAKYRLKQVYGQLIFSGYDTSRFRENSVSFTMADDVTRDLVVALQSISYSGSSSAALLSDSIDIYIDSTDPNFWLPDDVCDAFEKAFDLTLDDESGLYLVNETHRNALLDSDAEVSFRLSDVEAGGETVTITLPYAAFDLTAESPLVDNSTHYFPLKRANDSTQYTLGRTFLQEAYLSVDYERKVFNVSACVWNQGAEESIVTITAKGSGESTDGADGGGSSSKSSHLSGGAIAGIVVGSLAAAILIAAVIAFVVLRLRRKWIKAGFAVAATDPEPEDSVMKGPVFNSTPRSTSDNFMFVSPTDVSAARSTPEYSSSAVGSSPRPEVASGTSTGAGTVELDGHHTHVRPHTELDGKEIYINPDSMSPTAENSGLYELPGSEVADARGGKEKLKPGVGVPSSRDHKEKRKNSLDSQSVSTLDTTRGGEETMDSDIISPSTPAHLGARPF